MQGLNIKTLKYYIDNAKKKKVRMLIVVGLEVPQAQNILFELFESAKLNWDDTNQLKRWK